MGGTHGGHTWGTHMGWTQKEERVMDRAGPRLSIHLRTDKECVRACVRNREEVSIFVCTWVECYPEA